MQYGRLTPDDQVCAANIRYPVTSLSQGEREEKCLILEAIRTVEERCHGRESCTITASPDTLAKDLRDPCPLVRLVAMCCDYPKVFFTKLCLKCLIRSYLTKLLL